MQIWLYTIPQIRVTLTLQVFIKMLISLKQVWTRIDSEKVLHLTIAELIQHWGICCTSKYIVLSSAKCRTNKQLEQFSVITLNDSIATLLTDS